MILQTPRRIRIDQLQDELAHNGITVRLVARGATIAPDQVTSQAIDSAPFITELTAVLADGTIGDIPADQQSAVAAIVGTHVPQPTTLETTRGDLETTLQTAIAALQNIVQNGGTFTAAQVRDNLIVVARVNLALARYIRNRET